MPLGCAQCGFLTPEEMCWRSVSAPGLISPTIHRKYGGSTAWIRPSNSSARRTSESRSGAFLSSSSRNLRNSPCRFPTPASTPSSSHGRFAPSPRFLQPFRRCDACSSLPGASSLLSMGSPRTLVSSPSRNASRRCGSASLVAAISIGKWTNSSPPQASTSPSYKCPTFRVLALSPSRIKVSPRPSD